VEAVRPRYARHQVARGSRPDAGYWKSFLLVKYGLNLRLTYQIRLLTFFAAQEGKKLNVAIRRSCKISAELKQFLREIKKNIVTSYAKE